VKQGWKFLATCAALAMIVGVAPIAIAASPAKTSDESSAVDKSVSKRLRQFTGFVTSIDKETFSVEKRTKKTTRSKSFEKDADMRVEGELVEGAKVTVYYRSDGETEVAHRVVVKVPPDPDEES